jgi:hypothetical protein
LGRPGALGRRAPDLARAARLLEAAERLAQHAAARQAAIARAPRVGRFLARQARQEAFHARVFATAAACLAPGAAPAHPGEGALAAYRQRLDSDLDAGDLWSAVIGTQLTLEALGRAVLGELEAGLACHLPVLAPLHQVLVRQEGAHHAFGMRLVAQAAARGAVATGRARATAADYRELATGLLAASAELLDALGTSPAPYAARFAVLLPESFPAAA